jgi:hypothetical protein
MNHMELCRQTAPLGTDESAAVTLVHPPAPSLPRERNPAHPDVIRQIAQRLFDRADPTLPSSHVDATTRDIARIYTRAVHGPVQTRLANTIRNGERLFLHGAALGVGASVFTVDYVRAYNFTCRDRGSPDRIAHIQLCKGISTVRQFLEALCHSVQSHPTLLELRLASTLTLGRRILAQAERLRLTAIMIDHVHLGSDAVRSAIGDLMMVMDPAYDAPLEIDDHPPRRRIGIVLISHEPPERLFFHEPQVLALLQGAYEALRPYTTVEAITEALQQAGIGLEDMNPGDPEDRLLAERVLEATDGLIANIAGLLRLVDLLCAANGGCRPDLGIVEAALPYHRRMIRLLQSKDSGGRTVYRSVPNALRDDGRRKTTPSAEAQGRKASPGPPGGGSRVKVLKQKRADRDVADHERKQMVRRPYKVLPEEAP